MIDLKAAFELADASPLQFADATNKLHPRRDLCAFLLLDKLVPGAGNVIEAAEHDRIYFAVSTDDLAAVATQEDILLLVQCGVTHYDYDDGLTMGV